MKLNLKQSLPYLGGFLGAVALATAAFVGGMWYRGQLTSQPESTQQESCEDCIRPLPAPDTSNWRTYRNANPQYEISYPASWQIDTSEAVYKEGSSQGTRLTLAKGEYIFEAIQPYAWGPATCAFGDSEQQSSDNGSYVWRIEDFKEIVGDEHLYRRPAQPSEVYDENKVEWGICIDTRSSDKFWTNTPIGLIHYYAPVEFDPKLIMEMDEILRNIK